MPRVLRVMTRLNIGGPARQGLTLHRELPSLGWECLLAAGTSEGAEGDVAEWEDVEVLRIPGLRRGASPADAARTTAALRRLIRRYRPDVVHTHMAMAGATGRIAALGSLTRRVHTFHGHVLEGYFSPRRESAYALAERGLARRTHALVAVSESVREDLLDLGIGRPSQWHVVALGLELETLLKVPATLPATRTVGIVGRLVPIKDHETLLQAAARLLDVRFVVAGDGELRTELQRRASELGVAGRVDFRGWVRDLPALYAELDAVVLTSLNEGTPVALIEAMAAARPVVATRVGGVPDVLEDGACGLLVAPREPDALADAIRTVLDDGPHAAALARAGRASVRERFRASRLVQDIDALYRGLL